MEIIQIVFTSLLVICGTSWGQESCFTPNRSAGSCVSLRDCDYLYSILENRNSITQSDREYLRQSQCGTDVKRLPKVCCAPGSRYTKNDLPVPGKCGTQQLKDRVFGGENTTISDYPWMALLEYKKDSTTSFNCGGVIINENYILTAVHCISGAGVIRYGYTLISVRLGEHDLDKEIDCEQEECADPVVDIPVTETIVHENYKPNSATQNDDIALIRVAHPITFTEWVKPICLPISEQLRTKNFDGAHLAIAGFGRTENQTSSNVKLRLDVNGTNLQCYNDVYRRLNINISSKQLCAGGEEGKDSCNGDSGGPLMGDDVLDGFNSYTYLAGIVSFGPRACGTKGVPGVYTKVSEYNDRIVNHIRR